MFKIWDDKLDDKVYKFARKHEIKRKMKSPKLNSPPKRGREIVKQYAKKIVEEAKKENPYKDIDKITPGDALEIVWRPWKTAKTVHRDLGVLIRVCRRGPGMFIIIIIILFFVFVWLFVCLFFM